MYYVHKAARTVRCVKPNASQWRDDVEFPTVYRRIYRGRFLPYPIRRRVVFSSALELPLNCMENNSIANHPLKILRVNGSVQRRKNPLGINWLMTWIWKKRRSFSSVPSFQSFTFSGSNLVSINAGFGDSLGCSSDRWSEGREFDPCRIFYAHSLLSDDSSQLLAKECTKGLINCLEY